MKLTATYTKVSFHDEPETVYYVKPEGVPLSELDQAHVLYAVGIRGVDRLLDDLQKYRVIIDAVEGGV